MTSLKRLERRSLVLGALLFLGSAGGLFQFLSNDGLRADPTPRRRGKAEIQQAAAVDAAAQKFNEKMQAAMDAAVAKLDNFIAVIKKPKTNQTGFAVKYSVIEGDDEEYLWVNDLKYADQKFTGKIASQPGFVKKVKFGDQVTIAEDDVDDWMYIEDGKLKGGYTLRAHRELLTAEERKKFDEQCNFKFE